MRGFIVGGVLEVCVSDDVCLVDVDVVGVVGFGVVFGEGDC